MFRRTIGTALAAAVITAAALIIKKLDEQTEKPAETEEDDDRVNFVDIVDEDEEQEKKYPAEVTEIAEVYPYLKPAFIAEQLARNDAFNREYPEDTLVTICHKAKFEDPAVTEEYLRIASDNGYGTEKINENENQIIKKMFTTEGAILSDIYNVSNQVAALGGTYEGYKID
ncbi:MAG: hypothetical protein IJJ29_05640 [Solobacterium sp.]|nr:hypothetical protein [Solobacterium sp.]